MSFLALSLWPLVSQWFIQLQIERQFIYQSHRQTAAEIAVFGGVGGQAWAYPNINWEIPNGWDSVQPQNWLLRQSPKRHTSFCFSDEGEIGWVREWMERDEQEHIIIVIIISFPLIYRNRKCLSLGQLILLVLLPPPLLLPPMLETIW